MITDKQERKDSPLYSGCLRYFPKALARLARPRLVTTWSEVDTPAEAVIAAELIAARDAEVIALNALELLQNEITPGSLPAGDYDPASVHDLLVRYLDALTYVAHVSYVGSQQHNPGKPLFWDRSKSGDELDALARHLLEAGTIDTDGVRHSGKVAWRALANLEKTIERERATSKTAKRSAEIDAVIGTRDGVVKVHAPAGADEAENCQACSDPSLRELAAIGEDMGREFVRRAIVFLVDGGPVEDG